MTGTITLLENIVKIRLNEFLIYLAPGRTYLCREIENPEEEGDMELLGVYRNVAEAMQVIDSGELMTGTASIIEKHSSCFLEVAFGDYVLNIGGNVQVGLKNPEDGSVEVIAVANNISEAIYIMCGHKALNSGEKR